MSSQEPAVPPVALTIAGSDSIGGAGIQADLKAFSAFGVYGCSVITCVTAQDTASVHAVRILDDAIVAAQLDAVLGDLPVAAVKTGMLASPEIVEVVAAKLSGRPGLLLVVDPVLIATSGDSLAGPGTVESVRKRLFPLAALITPNLPEAEAYSGRRVATVSEMRDAARALCDQGARAVLVKGGHLEGVALDILLDDGGFHELAAERVPLPAVHGTGCMLSAAITAGLARGDALLDAVSRAKHFVHAALLEAPRLGRGARPLHPTQKG